MKPSLWNSSAGLSLIETVVALAAGTIGLTALLSSTSFMHRANRSAEIRTDLADVERTIRANLSCRHTFASFGAARPVNCAGAVTPMNKANQPLFKSAKLGDSTIETTCEVVNGANGLSFYATKKLPDGSIAVDPMTGKPYDKTNPVGTLFKPDARPCSDYFLASTATFNNCGAGQYLVGIDFDAQKLNCAVIPVCPSPSVLSFDGNVFRCTAGGFPAGTYCIIQAQGQGCPAGFISRDPSSCYAGTPLANECFLLRGGGSSLAKQEYHAMGMKNMRWSNVQRWAWCCK